MAFFLLGWRVNLIISDLENRSDLGIPEVGRNWIHLPYTLPHWQARAHVRTHICNNNNDKNQTFKSTWKLINKATIDSLRLYDRDWLSFQVGTFSICCLTSSKCWKTYGDVYKTLTWPQHSQCSAFKDWKKPLALIRHSHWMLLFYKWICLTFGKKWPSIVPGGRENSRFSETDSK